MPASITVFDGARCIGGNKIYLEFDGRGVFFDFGINYRKMAGFYEEFLSPRSTRGIHDFLFLGIIPNISCYRHDLVPRDVSLSSSLNLKPDAVFLSHAHMDHVGNVGLLDMNIPVVASPMSTAILKAMRDCGADMESEVAYAAPREKLREDTRLIKATDWRKGPYLGRKFLVAGECKSELKDFWSTSPNNRKLQSKELKPAEDSLDFEIHVKFADRLLDPKDVAKEPENYILCYSFWDMKHLLDIKPKNGTYIYSSSEAYNEDQVIDFLRLNNWLRFFNFKVRGFNIVERDGKAQPEFEKGYHASGHASASELLEIMREINPETILPVHTENPEFFEENLKEYRVLLAEEGKRIEIG